jgi:uncharacterized protein
MFDLQLFVLLSLCGAATGILAGVFGVGGGSIMVPVLYQVFTVMDVPADIRMQLAVGTSLAVIVPTSIRSFKGHFAKGMVDMAVLKVWLLPVVFGVCLGAGIAAFVTSTLLKLIFMTVIFLDGIKLLWGQEQFRIADTLPSTGVMRVYGLFMGLLSALMGIGGGLFGNIILALYGKSIHQAVATSSGLGVIISIPATVGYMLAGWSSMGQLPPYSIGFVSLLGAGFIMPLSILCAPIGVKLAHNLSKRALERAFGVFLICVGVRFFASLVFGI